MITYLGWATLNGVAAPQSSLYQVPQPKGFFLVVEAMPGVSGFNPGTDVFNWGANTPSLRPDLQVEVSQNLGNGSPMVCDVGPAPTPPGGVPGIGPTPSFALTQAISDALNDFGCRFTAHSSQLDACTGDGAGTFFFVNSASRVQFCAPVDSAIPFASGNTTVTVQVLDAPPNAAPGTGVPGPTMSVVIQAP